MTLSQQIGLGSLRTLQVGLVSRSDLLCSVIERPLNKVIDLLQVLRGKVKVGWRKSWLTVMLRVSLEVTVATWHCRR